LEVPSLVLAINKVPLLMDQDDVRFRVESAYDVSVGGVFPLNEEMAMNASRDPFAISHPDHLWSQQLRCLAARILEDG